MSTYVDPSAPSYRAAIGFAPRVDRRRRNLANRAGFSRREIAPSTGRAATGSSILAISLICNNSADYYYPMVFWRFGLLCRLTFFESSGGLSLFVAARPVSVSVVLRARRFRTGELSVRIFALDPPLRVWRRFRSFCARCGFVSFPHYQTPRILRCEKRTAA